MRGQAAHSRRLHGPARATLANESIDMVVNVMEVPLSAVIIVDRCSTEMARVAGLDTGLRSRFEDTLDVAPAIGRQRPAPVSVDTSDTARKSLTYWLFVSRQHR